MQLVFSALLLIGAVWASLSTRSIWPVLFTVASTIVGLEAGYKHARWVREQKGEPAEDARIRRILREELDRTNPAQDALMVTKTDD